MKENKIILIGELIIDKNLYLKKNGKSAEFFSPKKKLIKTDFNLGGAGMVYSALNLLKKKIFFLTIAETKFKKFFSKKLKKNIFFDRNYKFTKSRYWQDKKLIMQINDIKINKFSLVNFQSDVLKKIKKISNKSIVVLSDYRGAIFQKKFTKKIIEIMKKKNCIIFLDQQSTSKEPDLVKFKNVDYLVLNQEEYKKAFKRYKIINKNFNNSLSQLQQILKIKNFIVKKGKNGSIFFSQGKLIKASVYKKLKTGNIIGAGDYFLAKFITINNKNIYKRLANSNMFSYKKIKNRNFSKSIKM